MAKEESRAKHELHTSMVKLDTRDHAKHKLHCIENFELHAFMVELGTRDHAKHKLHCIENFELHALHAFTVKLGSRDHAKHKLHRIENFFWILIALTFLILYIQS